MTWSSVDSVAPETQAFTQTFSDNLYYQKSINPHQHPSILDSFALIEYSQRLSQLSLAHGSEDAVRCGRGTPSAMSVTAPGAVVDNFASFQC